MAVGWLQFAPFAPPKPLSDETLLPLPDRVPTVPSTPAAIAIVSKYGANTRAITSAVVYGYEHLDQKILANVLYYQLDDLEQLANILESNLQFNYY